MWVLVWFELRSSTEKVSSDEIWWHSSSKATKRTLSFSFLLHLSCFPSLATNFVKAVLFCGFRRNLLHCCTLWSGWRFLNSFPYSAPLCSLSAFLIEFSLYTSKITSILLEDAASCRTIPNKESATSENSYGHLSTFALMPYHQWLMPKAGESPLHQAHSFEVLLLVLPCWFYAMTHLLWIAPKKQVPADDRGHLSYEAVCFLLLWTFDRKALSAFSMTTCCFALDLYLLENERENVFRFDFFREMWNLTSRGFASSRFTRDSLPFPREILRSADLCVATFPVDKHTKSCFSELNGFIQLLSSKVVSDFTSAWSLGILDFRRSCALNSFCLDQASLSAASKNYFDIQTLCNTCSQLLVSSWNLLCRLLFVCPYWHSFLHKFDQREPFQRGFGDRSAPKIHQNWEIHRPLDVSPRGESSQTNILVNSGHNFCYRSARFAANPISDSRNQVIRISPWTSFDFRFQKSLCRILFRKTNILETENK